ncbi:hypothetical protein SCG7086_BQ_00110 [Chlamydiales bacterium SCGC AG-110-P3]|nr:hypothetical protein SCG7086_BQ_00110 [Chlamydiales bacterium SCGC AG-110-P3]
MASKNKSEFLTGLMGGAFSFSPVSHAKAILFLIICSFSLWIVQNLLRACVRQVYKMSENYIYVSSILKYTIKVVLVDSTHT